MRGKQTVRDMVLSMAAIGALVGGVYLFIPHNDSKSAQQDAVKTVDYRVEVATVRRTAPYPVAVPEGLAGDWRATSVSYKASSDSKGGAWHLGFLDPKDEYVALEQSDAPAEKFIKDVTLGAEKAQGGQSVGDAKWERYKGEKYNALVRQESGVTTVVTGTASYDRLAELAGTLKAKKG
jgi:hypothetical protein